MTKIPVFDVGDSLMPSYRLQNQLIRDKFKDNGDEPPEFDVNDFRIYNPGHVERYMEKHGLNGLEPEEIVKEYKRREQRFLEEKEVFEFLKRCSGKFGKIGFVSDNSLKGKEWFKRQLESHNVPYEGLVVSEEVGVEKPDSRIFEEFLDRRDEVSPDRFVYIGNNVERDKASQKVGIDFIWIKQYKTFGSSYDGVRIEELSFESLKRAISRLEMDNNS